MPFNLGAPELMVVLFIVLLIFGPGKLPDMGSALGKSIREFRRGVAELSASSSEEASAAREPGKDQVSAETPQRTG